MPKFIDLSHDFADGMPGFRLKNEDGSLTEFSAHVQPFITHAQSRPKYQGQAEFEITEMHFQTSIGTYLDSPYHRFVDGPDISEIRIDDVVLPGVVIDVRGRQPWQAVGPEVLPPPAELNLRGKAVLFHFGWDQYWGTDAYYAYPFVSKALLAELIARGMWLLGVDTLNADDIHDLARPAHTMLLAREIYIVENLTGLEQLLGQDFRFFAVPIKAKRTAAMPVRAFAERVG
jgi:kynurenine formamidase